MLKRLIILLISLAYALTMVHSLVPHHHHDEKTHVQRSHDHSSGHHHHHHDSDEDEDKALSHFFGDVTHHPSGKIFIHNANVEGFSKVKTFVQYSVITSLYIPQPKIEPPDEFFSSSSGHYHFKLGSNSLLRAPPAI
jgi:hypothetical protein